ncbi:MAG TPA: GspH/FimT family pseudopilin [Gemmatimonadales bacterium]|jgi:prepilin-type N-terminal cleavage/methylation domain-containing protein|nr:GspH/FimT family pseudopilin [Gemmatimonadales bacterium]
MRRGITLIELLLVLIVTGLLSAIALPRFATLADDLAVEAAARHLVGAHRRARMIAILESRPVVLTIAPDSLVIRLGSAGPQSWRASGPVADGVALAGGAKQIVFSPVGVTAGLSNASFQLTRGGASRTVVVSRLGRVRILP